MNKSRKNRNRGKPLEQRAFETLGKQVHQLDEPPLSGTAARKPGGNKPPRLTVILKLKNGNIIKGSCVCFDNPRMPKSRFFFPAENNRKDVGIPSAVDARDRDCEPALIKDLNGFLRDVHEQAMYEFPEWLEKWGCRANESNPLLNLDEIREEWKYNRVQFGIFRLAVQAGFFTKTHPFYAERLEIVSIEIAGTP
jgi:hypothetical protein